MALRGWSLCAPWQHKAGGTGAWEHSPWVGLGPQRSWRASFPQGVKKPQGHQPLLGPHLSRIPASLACLPGGSAPRQTWGLSLAPPGGGSDPPISTSVRQAHRVPGGTDAETEAQGGSRPSPHQSTYPAHLLGLVAPCHAPLHDACGPPRRAEGATSQGTSRLGLGAQQDTYAHTAPRPHSLVVSH